MNIHKSDRPQHSSGRPPDSRPRSCPRSIASRDAGRLRRLLPWRRATDAGERSCRRADDNVATTRRATVACPSSSVSSYVGLTSVQLVMTSRTCAHRHVPVVSTQPRSLPSQPRQQQLLLVIIMMILSAVHSAGKPLSFRPPCPVAYSVIPFFFYKLLSKISMHFKIATCTTASNSMHCCRDKINTVLEMCRNLITSINYLLITCIMNRNIFCSRSTQLDG